MEDIWIKRKYPQLARIWAECATRHLINQLTYLPELRKISISQKVKLLELVKSAKEQGLFIRY